MNLNRNPFLRKRQSYTRFIIYFIVLFILYQFTKFLIKSIFYNVGDDSVNASLAHHDIAQKRKSKYLKQQTVLEFEANNGTTFMDFPWYQKPHTRPQFKPNANLTTIQLSIKERGILQQKAILKAKKHAFRKFPPEDYVGIRGSKLTGAEETAAFRHKVDCWTKGQWVQQDEAFALKHVQDSLYSTCDDKFYKSHSKDQKREAVKYRWQPHVSEDCPAITTEVDSKKWCSILHGKHMLLVGDLVHYQYHELLLDAFRHDPTVCFGELNCKGIPNIYIYMDQYKVWTAHYMHA
jgi:hypothetical protein